MRNVQRLVLEVLDWGTVSGLGDIRRSHFLPLNDVYAACPALTLSIETNESALFPPERHVKWEKSKATISSGILFIRWTSAKKLHADWQCDRFYYIGFILPLEIFRWEGTPTLIRTHRSVEANQIRWEPKWEQTTSSYALFLLCGTLRRSRRKMRNQIRAISMADKM